jgi:hypothetical protein
MSCVAQLLPSRSFVVHLYVLADRRGFRLPLKQTIESVAFATLHSFARIRLLLTLVENW